MLFEFFLFLILGLAVFVPLEGTSRTVVLVVFVVLMVLWIALGISPGVSSNGWGHLFSR